jgi:hypothetical protein
MKWLERGDRVRAIKQRIETLMAEADDERLRISCLVGEFRRSVEHKMSQPPARRSGGQNLRSPAPSIPSSLNLPGRLACLPQPTVPHD